MRGRPAKIFLPKDFFRDRFQQREALSEKLWKNWKRRLLHSHFRCWNICLISHSKSQYENCFWMWHCEALSMPVLSERNSQWYSATVPCSYYKGLTVMWKICEEGALFYHTSSKFTVNNIHTPTHILISLTQNKTNKQTNKQTTIPTKVQ